MSGVVHELAPVPLHRASGHRLQPTITASRSVRKRRPAARHVAELTMAPRGEATDVTWAMYGPSTIVTELMSVVIDVDRMIGTDFEARLANLKALAEQRGAVAV